MGMEHLLQTRKRKKWPKVKKISTPRTVGQREETPTSSKSLGIALRGGGGGGNEQPFGCTVGI